MLVCRWRTSWFSDLIFEFNEKLQSFRNEMMWVVIFLVYTRRTSKIYTKVPLIPRQTQRYWIDQRFIKSENVCPENLRRLSHTHVSQMQLCTSLTTRFAEFNTTHVFSLNLFWNRFWKSLPITYVYKHNRIYEFHHILIKTLNYDIYLAEII